MNDALINTNVRRDLPALWEVLWAVSGLVAIVVLAVIVAAMALLGEPKHPDRSLAIAPVDPAANSSGRVALPVSASMRRVLAFYLVRTPQQREIADEDEAEAFYGGYLTPGRQYRILYARDEAEEQFAATAILDSVLQLQDAVLVDVIDLRSLQPGER